MEPTPTEEPSTETKTGKRKRGSKKPVETEETNISNGRPRRTLPKRKFVFLLNYDKFIVLKI